MKAVEEIVIAEIADKAFSKNNVLSIMKEVRRSLLEAERPVRAIGKELAEIEKKIQRYYEAFENGDMDPALVAKRLELQQAEDKRLRAELKRRTAITELPAHIGSDANIERVQRELRSMIKTSPPGSIREYLRIIQDKIVVNGYELEIHGYSAGVMATLAVNKDDNEQGITRVSVEVNKWQPVRGCTYNPLYVFCLNTNINKNNILYFHSEQIGEWLAELLEQGVFKSQRDMAQEFGLHHSRIGQFLAFMKLPVKERNRLRGDSEVREYQPRALRCG